MFSEIIKPRFSDTDALGHIGNTAIPVWFEGARDPVFKMLSPTLDLQKWPIILAKTEIEFHAQLFYGQDIEVRTYLAKVGNASFHVYQEVWQQEIKCASGTATMVYFCYDMQKSKPIPDDIRNKLTEHLYQA
ncbi:thioesterase family protein [Thalassotalea psychrophila]|uniref:Thioesterase family protein n=1 Tax=Thalassotalea psychrophila TaxID=3065647 RepID=A0ABY9TVJ2_9GAMM|nr:thioesterase family protein [Colwelliaceae bacterium SQ149]